MSNSAFQLQFAAELLAMLVAAAGVVLVVLRADLTGSARWARVALAVGFVAVGVAAFVHGSLVASSTSELSRRGIGGLRLAGDAAVAAGCLRWRASLRVRLALWFGVLVGGAAAAVDLMYGSWTVADVLLIVGSAGVAVALVIGSRRSIVAQVAAGAAATLLLMVLVLSVALSSVIASSAQQNQLASLASRARVEGGSALAEGASALKDARFVAADLQGYFRTDPGLLIDLHAATGSTAAGTGAAAVSGRLGELAGLYPTEGLAYVTGPAQAITAPTPAVDAHRLANVARQPLVANLTCADSSGKSSVVATGGALETVAAYPECLAAPGASLSVGPGDSLLGVVVVTAPLDDSYLAARQRIDPSVSLSLVTPAGVLATAGPQPPDADLRSAASRVAASDRSSVSTTAARELAVTPLAPAGTPVAVLVASTSDSSVVAVRARLERTLFLIALGGTVIALLFVAAIGERITSGLRRLTQVAVRVRRGGTGERADITSRDEVGLLGAAFDSMVASIEQQTGALQLAADDEMRLRNRLQAVVAGMGDALVATDTAGRITEFNAAAERLSGVAATAALGAPLRQVVDVVGAEGAPLGPRSNRPDQASTQLAVLRRADGLKVPVAVSDGVLRGPGGQPGGQVSVLRDLRREQEIERMKSEFLSRVGHELRTPLTAIMGYSEILTQRSATPAQSQAWHREILASAKRLARIVEMLEFVASSGAGRVLLHPESHDVNVLVREVVAAWTDRLGDRHSLTKRVARNTPSVLADRRWLGLAIDELMDNALKFSPHGGRVVVSAGAAPDGAAVDITIGDRGMGMTPQEQALAFGEFVQGDASDTRRFGGLGLGLALVQRVVEGHGGSVLCDSAPGAGSRLTLRLPAAPSPSPSASLNGRGKGPVPAHERR